jgi:hypothetical protein
MTHRPGTTVPATGIYWCSVCKLPKKFEAEETFSDCANMCGRGSWELVKVEGAEGLPRE